LSLCKGVNEVFKRFDSWTYLVSKRSKLLRTEVLKVLTQVLKGKITAHEDTVDLAIRASELRQGSLLLALLDSLEETLKSKT
jgi:hypothetical protein